MNRKNKNKVSRRFSRLDQWILVLTLLWVGIGIAMLMEVQPSRHPQQQHGKYSTRQMAVAAPSFM